MRLAGSPFAAVAFVAALVAAGCVQPEDLPVEDNVAPAPALPPTAAMVHFTKGNLSSTDLEAMAHGLLPNGLPLPIGALRYIGGSSFEPTIGVDAEGAIFMSIFERGTPTGINLVRRSLDQGVTWEDVTPRFGPTSFPPNSNDPYVYVDVDTGRVYLSDLQALVCSTLAWSDDQGETWTPNPVGCGHPFGVHDHQTVFSAKPRMATTVGYDKVVYYCVNRVADSVCATSLNGGITFGPLRPVYRGIYPEQAEPGTDPVSTVFSMVCGGLHAHGAAAPDGTVYLPKGHCGYATVAVTKDDGLTWTQHVISEEHPVLGHEVPVAIDEAGNVYALWISSVDRLPYLSVSQDQGATWSPAVMVAPPNVKQVDLPTIAAGSDGRVAVAYYGSETPPDATEWGNTTWNAYIGITLDALSEAPVFATAPANDPADPVGRGECYGRCLGGDFIDIVIDAEGRPWAAFVDKCIEECATPEGSENAGADGFAATFALGPKLRGDLGELLPLPDVAAPEPEA